MLITRNVRCTRKGKKKRDEPTSMVTAEHEPEGKNQSPTASATADVIKKTSIRTDLSISHS
jgi:hypothetical protein